MKFLLPIIAAALCGCVQTRFTTPNGAKFSTIRVLWNGAITSAEINTNGTGRIVGYQSDSAQMAEAIARGVANGLKP